MTSTNKYFIYVITSLILLVYSLLANHVRLYNYILGIDNLSESLSIIFLFILAISGIFVITIYNIGFVLRFIAVITFFLIAPTWNLIVKSTSSIWIFVVIIPIFMTLLINESTRYKRRTKN